MKNYREIIKYNFNVILIFSFFSFLYFTYFQKFIPYYFKVDSWTIRYGFIVNLDKSYSSTVDFYSFLGFNSLSPEFYIQLFSWVIYFLILLTILRINGNKMINKIQVSMILFFTIIYGFYFTTFAKDEVLMFYLILCINIYLSIKKNYIFVIFMFIYGYFYRSYWILFSLISVLLFIRNRKKITLKYFMFVIISIIISYNLILRNQITNIRFNINENRTFYNVNSMLNNIINNHSIFTDIINYFYSLLCLILPIQGIGSINVIVYYIYVWLILYYIYKYNKYLDSKMIYILFAYLNIQAFFEPDLGSAFRHLISLFLLFYLFVFGKLNIKN